MCKRFTLTFTFLFLFLLPVWCKNNSICDTYVKYHRLYGKRISLTHKEKEEKKMLGSILVKDFEKTIEQGEPIGVCYFQDSDGFVDLSTVSSNVSTYSKIVEEEGLYVTDAKIKSLWLMVPEPEKQSIKDDCFANGHKRECLLIIEGVLMSGSSKFYNLTVAEVSYLRRRLGLK